MRADGDAAAHVGNDEVERVIGLSDVLGVALGDGLLVERVEDGAAREVRMAGQVRDVGHFVDHGRVNDERGLSDLLADLRGKDAAEVADVRAEAALAQVAQHLVVDGVGSAGDRMHQTAAADHGVEALE